MMLLDCKAPPRQKRLECLLVPSCVRRVLQCSTNDSFRGLLDIPEAFRMADRPLTIDIKHARILKSGDLFLITDPGWKCTPTAAWLRPLL